MILLKILLAIVGLTIIGVSIVTLFAGFAEDASAIFGIISAGIVLCVFRIESVAEFFNMDDSVLDFLALGAFVGGAIIASIGFEWLGGVMYTAGWVAVGMILLQIIPISFISDFVQVAAMPFVIACVPVFIIIALFKM